MARAWSNRPSDCKVRGSRRFRPIADVRPHRPAPLNSGVTSRRLRNSHRLLECVVFMFSECSRCLADGLPSLLLKWLILLSAPLMIGGVVLLGRVLGLRSDRVIIGWTLTSFFLFLVVPSVLVADIPDRYSPLTLNQGPFEWPTGCARRVYEEGDSISISCHDGRNELPRKLVFDHGYPGAIGRSEQQRYFRVGSDAVNFDCNYFTNRCSVRHVEKSVFQ